MPQVALHGRDDVAGRASNGDWYVGRSVGAGFVSSKWENWNEAGRWRDVRAGDFDGDGKDDLAGRTSEGDWYVGRGVGTGFVTSLWGEWNEAADWTTLAD